MTYCSPSPATPPRSLPRSKACAAIPWPPAPGLNEPPSVSPKSSGASSVRTISSWSTDWSPAPGAAEMAELLLITPARDEAAHLERTIRAVAAQTQRPDLWLIVDDDSTDATPEILARAAGELPFLRALRAPRNTAANTDRLAVAAEARAFNWGLESLDLDDYTHVGKLDADIELPAEYFERLIEGFEREPRLGIAGGGLLERGRNGWQLAKVPDYHVRGALKLYSRECFAAIGGIEERLGWGTIDETHPRLNGFT